MYDQSRRGSEYLDLITYTDCKRFIFDPYFEINDPSFIDYLYGSGLYRALVNVYPQWDLKPNEGIDNDKGRCLFLVFDDTKVDKADEDYIRFSLSDHVSYIENRGDYPFTIMAVNVPDDICSKYIKGEFSRMYKKKDLLRVRDMFELESKFGGILYQDEEYLSDTFHVLAKTKQYEEMRIKALGVDPEGITLKELRTKPTLHTERLRLDLLMKQI